ncbi:MAG TPA: DUF2231 domain-containing protein [Phycisphaerales bacterium]|nr:DUF2231 domain-containing protein [Phycisphaerales bacterium]
MRSRARVLGHSVHQMLVVFPLGLLGTAAVFDVIFLFTRNLGVANAAYWMILAGLITGLLAAVFGIIDWSAIPRGTRANRIGLTHAIVNVAALSLFAISFALRTADASSPPPLAVALSLAGLAVAVLGGWLGGELVTRLGVGVDDGANLNAPNSIAHPSALDSVARRAVSTTSPRTPDKRPPGGF